MVSFFKEMGLLLRTVGHDTRVIFSNVENIPFPSLHTHGIAMGFMPKNTSKIYPLVFLKNFKKPLDKQHFFAIAILPDLPPMTIKKGLHRNALNRGGAAFAPNKNRSSGIIGVRTPHIVSIIDIDGPPDFVLQNPRCHLFAAKS